MGLALPLGLTGFWAFLQGQFVTPSNFILRSAEELLALRNLFDDEDAWPELVSLSERMALWKMGTVTELAPPEEDCLPLSTGAAGGERVRHRFEFASRKGISSRVYAVEYVSCKQGEGSYEVRRGRFGFGSRFESSDEPLLNGPVSLRILRLAFQDRGVSRDLVEALREESIAHCRVSHVEPTAKEHVSIYRFVATDGNSPRKVVLEYRVEYDADRDMASFLRL
jgi:hypothetical protein